MSHKIAKQVRKHTRQYLVGLPRTAYSTGPGRFVAHQIGLWSDGTPRTVPFQITGTIRLIDHCQKRQQRLLTRKLREIERQPRRAS